MVSQDARRAAATEDAIDLLLAQHARIEELFREVLTAEGEQRRAPFAELVHLLTVHEAAEQAVVHPLAREHIDEGPEVIAARIEEEVVAKQLLAQLDEEGLDAPDFAPQLIALRDVVLKHAKREERYEFRQLRQATDVETRRRLADAVRAAEVSAPVHPHPSVEAR